jgi:hypothetical protein
MTGLGWRVDADRASALARETELVLRRVHAGLARDWSRDVAAEGSADGRRLAALDLAAALTAHFGLGARIDRVAGARAREAAAELRTGPILDAGVAADVLADLFGESVGESGRRDRGAIYTPNDVVEWMVSEALEARISEALGLRRTRARDLLAGRAVASDAERREMARLMLGLRVLDPAAGAGAFLVGSARVIAATAGRLAAGGIPGIERLTTPLGALERCCHGFEIDPESAEIATAVVLLSTRAHSDHAPSGRPVVSIRDPLVAGLEHPMAPSGWDLVVMNPPYVGEKHIKTRLGADVAQSLRDAHGFARDLLVHFALCGLDALRDGGAMSAIVSDTSFTMETATELRRRVVDEHRIHSLAWCRPFAGVAVRGGILTVVKNQGSTERDPVEWIAADNGRGLSATPRNSVDPKVLSTLPSRPFFRPTSAATTFVERWSSVERLDEVWHAVAARRGRGQIDTHVGHLAVGDWTLLGAVVRSGQGLATGDDRRFVGYVRGTPEGDAAEARVARIVDTIAATPEHGEAARELSVLVASGTSQQEALLDLVMRTELLAVPGRKPFRVVEPQDVRESALTEREQETGIAVGPCWVPYETSDRSSPQGGARWLRTNATVIDWSTDAVALLHERRQSGDRRPVLRNQDLWFQGGVTHNRVTSYLRARRLPSGAVFSSESPVYVPLVEWLDEESLLALLNSSLIEFAVKTFLASRNHIEVGHLRRLPVPVLAAEQRAALGEFGRAACDAAATGDAERVRTLEAALDEYVRELYGLSRTVTLEVVR